MIINIILLIISFCCRTEKAFVTQMYQNENNIFDILSHLRPKSIPLIDLETKYFKKRKKFKINEDNSKSCKNEINKKLNIKTEYSDKDDINDGIIIDLIPIPSDDSIEKAIPNFSSNFMEELIKDGSLYLNPSTKKNTKTSSEFSSSAFSEEEKKLKNKYISLYTVICYSGRFKKKADFTVKKLYQILGNKIKIYGLSRKYINNRYEITIGNFFTILEANSFLYLYNKFENFKIKKIRIINDYEEIMNILNKDRY